MNKNIFLILTLMFFSIHSFAENNNNDTENITRTFKGKISSGLYAEIRNLYQASETHKECIVKHSNWANGITYSKKKESITSIIIPDEVGNYEVTLPIKYPDKNLCSYEYLNTTITIKRHKDDEQLSIFNLAYAEKPGYTYSFFKSPIKELREVLKIPEPIPFGQKTHFQISDNSLITCFTTFVEDEVKTYFLCFEEYESTDRFDEFNSSIINLDIMIDEQLCASVSNWAPDSKSDVLKAEFISKDYFREYQSKSIFKPLISEIISVIILAIIYIILLSPMILFVAYAYNLLETKVSFAITIIVLVLIVSSLWTRMLFSNNIGTAYLAVYGSIIASIILIGLSLIIIVVKKVGSYLSKRS